MGLRCSLLGHDYGDVVVEHEQDERGSEIVVTVRELRECRRCSAESIVSENTEVRRRRPEDDRGETDESAAAETDEATVEDTERYVEAAEDPATFVEEAEASTAERERADEDAIILDDTPDGEPASSESGTEHGTHTEDGRADAGADVQDTADEPAEDSRPPTTGGDLTDETAETGAEATGAGSDTATETDDAEDSAVAADETGDGAGERPTETQRPPGQEWPAERADPETEPESSAAAEPWPHQPESDTDRDTSPGPDETTPAGEFQFETSSGDDETDGSRTDPSSGIKSAGPIDLTGPPDGSLDGILHCPACGYSVAIARSSNRAGDICPDCHAGYLAEER